MLVQPAPVEHARLSFDPLEVAMGAGRRLVRDALWWGDRCTWMGWTNEVVGKQMVSAFRPVGWNVYDGVAGIAVFLARLHCACDDREIRAHAHGAARQLLAFDPGPSHEEGFYIGSAGTAWALVEVGTLLDLPDARERGVELLLQRPADSENPDVLSGLAGKILAALDVFRTTGDPRVPSLVAAAADRLLALARPDAEGGRRWLMQAINPRAALTGYSHGAAGIALAFAEAAAALGREDCAAAAGELLAYERGLFDPGAGNWPDLRPRADGSGRDEPAFDVTWCNGAAGIGLARLALWGRRPCPELSAEIEAAALATRNHLDASPELNASLCHGLCGNLEFLHDAARLLRRPDLLDGATGRLERLVQEAIESSYSLRSGVMSRQDSPGLFLGLAGVGHFFLRLWDPVGVESVLVFHTVNG